MLVSRSAPTLVRLALNQRLERRFHLLVLRLPAACALNPAAAILRMISDSALLGFFQSKSSAAWPESHR